jgi:hypothetical protein
VPHCHLAPAGIAATRLDFADRLKTLSARERRIAENLVLSETTGHVDRVFRICAARVSQIGVTSAGAGCGTVVD